jgi:hypothetical protein
MCYLIMTQKLLIYYIYFPTQICRLIIKYSPNVDFTSLINLRSLTIKYGTRAQLDGIRPEDFPMLEILHIRNGKLQ